MSNYAPVAIAGGCVLDVSNPANLGGSGSVFIHSGALTIDGSEIYADNYGAGPGGEIALDRRQPDPADQRRLRSGRWPRCAGSGTGIVISTGPTGAIAIDTSR